MVQSRSWWTVLLLAATAVLAGCVDDPPADDVEPATQPSGSSAAPLPSQATPSSSGPILNRVQENEAVFAPTWEVGQGWTYDVAGAAVGEGYTATIGVYDDASDHYKLASDNDREEELRLILGESLFLNGVQKDSLAVKSGANYQDVIGFLRATGASWEATLFKAAFDLTKVSVGDVTHAAGTAPGIRVEGARGPNEIVIEYASDAQNIVFLEWKENGTVMISYTLTEFQRTGVAGLVTWDVGTPSILVAEPTFTTASVSNWASDGAHDVVLLTGECGIYDPSNPTTRPVFLPTAPYRPAVATVLDPANQEAMTMQCEPLQRSFEAQRVEDQAGTWRGVGASGGPKVEIKAYWIKVVPV